MLRWDDMHGSAGAAALRRPVEPCMAFPALFVSAVLSVIIALVPMGVELSPCPALNIHMSEALAAEGGGSAGFYDASGYLDEIWSALDTLPEEFVATVVGVVAGGTGINLSDGDISYGNSLGENLGSLASAANYPEWENLTDAEREGWGNKQNYDSAKFNDLLLAFGLSDSLARYKASGGGDFDFTDDELDILKDLRSIGWTWQKRGSVAFEKLSSMVNRNAVVSAYGPVYEYYQVPEDEETWPADWSRTIRVYETDKEYEWLNNRTYYTVTDRPVYILMPYTGSQIHVFYFSRDTFYRNGSNSTNYIVPSFNTDTTTGNYGISTSYSIDGELQYYFWHKYRNLNLDNAELIFPGIINVPAKNATLILNECKAAALVLLGLDGRDNYQLVIDYPDETPSADTPIYYPESNGNQGIKRDTPWQKFITIKNPPYTPPTPEERPQNPYNPSTPDNPSYQSGTPEWNQETSENLQPALHIAFDKLFPFCMIYDLKLFWDRLKSVAGVTNDGGLGEQATSQYQLVTIPGIDFPGLQQGFTFDLEPVAIVLHYVRPAFFWMLVVLTIMSVIDFWRSILTGS